MIQNGNNSGLIYEMNNFNDNSKDKRAGSTNERGEEIYKNASTAVEHFDVYDDDGKGNFEKIKESNDPYLFKFYESISRRT